MKPPPRTRTKPERDLKPELVPQRSGKLACKWQRAEQRRLLNALKRLSRTAGALSDIDYVVLRTSVPTRSITEVTLLTLFSRTHPGSTSVHKHSSLVIVYSNQTNEPQLRIGLKF